jgi:uncharacterized protein (TIGR00661 family)
MPFRRKKFIFLVQGEGRGHMTQAISLYQILTNHGHQIQHIFIGNSNRREVPEYFIKSFNAPVELIDSPNFICDHRNKSIRLIPSIIYNLKYLIRFRKSLKRIHIVMSQNMPDTLINFYDFLGGFYNYFYRPKARYIVIGHQFLASHPEFRFSPGNPVHKNLFLGYNYLTSLGAELKLALSFMPYKPQKIGNMMIVPPLLRDQLHQLKVDKKDFILGYMVNDGYSQEIINWNRRNPATRLHIFWDKKGEPEVKYITDTLAFHQLNADKFLGMMAECRGFITTAGFESICEALYLGKPVLMVPVKGQYEQACNAIEAVKAGAGIQADYFGISMLLEFISLYKQKTKDFKAWYAQGHSLFVKELTGSTAMPE